MIDQVLSLRARGHRGKIRVLSRRGLVPHPHLAQRAAPLTTDLSRASELSAILRALRQDAVGAPDWRGVIDGLRPQTQALWQRLSLEQRSRFLRHALAWWNIHRHRIAPDVHAQFSALIEDGTVTVEAGFLRGIAADGDRLRVEYRPRGTSQTVRLSADLLVNCTGMERAGIGHSPLLKAMCDCGLIAMDDLGLGISVDGMSRVLDPQGKPRPGMFAAGALTAGQFWEITAVPDIRVQAHRIADEVAGALKLRQPVKVRRA
jgi:uncharacterized NAD(P)/FAD-binding protein YdhS